MSNEQEPQTDTRYFREHIGGPDAWYRDKWWRQNGSAGDGYATVEEARAEADPDSYVDDSRIVAVVITVVTTVVE